MKKIIFRIVKTVLAFSIGMFIVYWITEPLGITGKAVSGSRLSGVMVGTVLAIFAQVDFNKL